MLEHINNKLEHKESGITVKNHIASPRHQDFEELGSPKSLESWKDVKDFNDILTNIQDHDTKMAYQPVVLDKDQYFEKIGYDKKYEKAMNELSNSATPSNNVSSKHIAMKIAKYEYHMQEAQEKDKSKNKSVLEVHDFL